MKEVLKYQKLSEGQINKKSTGKAVFTKKGKEVREKKRRKHQKEMQLHQRFPWKSSWKYPNRQLYATMLIDFPYIISLAKNCKIKLSPNAREFYNRIYEEWGEEAEMRGGSVNRDANQNKDRQLRK